MLAQQTIPASSDARHAPPMAPDAEMRLALDDVALADLQCQPGNAATAVSGSSWEWSMGNPTEFSGPAGLHDPDLDDLPVRLVFELGRVELSLGELQRLAPGALVPLSRPRRRAARHHGQRQAARSRHIGANRGKSRCTNCEPRRQ